jgi:hypothetical protein
MKKNSRAYIIQEGKRVMIDPATKEDTGRVIIKDLKK